MSTIGVLVRSVWVAARPALSARWGLGVFLLAVGAWLATHLDFFALDYDEGVYLAEAWWLAQGEPLYTVVRTPLPPLLPWGVGWLFALLGSPSVTAARLLVVLCGLRGIAATAGIARQLTREQPDMAALTAAVMVGVAPLWLTYSRLVLADIPALMLALGAVWSGLRVWQDGGRGWLGLVAAGGLAAAAALTKFSVFFLAPLLAVVLLWRPGNTWSTLRRDLLAVGGGAFAITLPVFLALDAPAAYREAIRYHMNVRAMWDGPPYSWRVLFDFVLTHAAWWLAAGLGLALLGLCRRWREAALLAVWLGAVGGWALFHRPLWLHLLLPLLPPLGIAAGVGLSQGAELVKGTLQGRRWLLAANVIGLVLVWGISWPRAAQLTRAALAPPSHTWHWETVLGAWLKEAVPPGEFIITDDPMIAVRTGRWVPPALTDTSYTRIRSGQLTADDLIAEAGRTRPAAIVSWRDRFPLLPEWLAWVEAHYVLRCDYGPHRRVYLRPDLAQHTRPCPGP